jgi:aminopeptidase N
VTRKDEDFYFPLDSAPELVRVDPEFTLLAKINFTPPNAMLETQLQQTDDVIGRLLAIEQLANKHDQDSINRLRDVLQNDSFYGVRLAASKALASRHTDESLQALLVSTGQTDARVRQQVLADLGGFYNAQACEAVLRAMEQEKNPAIVASCLRLAGYPGSHIAESLSQHLHAVSYRNEVASGAIAGMRLQDDPVFIAPLLTILSEHEGDFTSYGFAQGLRALAYLGRNEDHKDSVREFLLTKLNHKKRSVQLACISALGTLGDPKAIPALQPFADSDQHSPQREPAERAIAELRAGRKPVDDFKNLRQEVLDLEKSNRELRAQLDDLKKRVDATKLQAASGPKAKKGAVSK